MSKIAAAILSDFQAALAAEKIFDAKHVEAVCAALSTGKKPKPEELIAAFSLVIEDSAHDQD